MIAPTKTLLAAVALMLAIAVPAAADMDDIQSPPSLLAPPVKDVVRYAAPVVAITHVRIIDGTGAPARDDQTLIIERGTIAAVGPAVAIPPNAQVVDGHGESLLPGYVGTHNHLYYAGGGPLFFMHELPYSFPRLYLAAGVTTMRTAGSLEPYTDIRVKAAIDSGDLAGPKMDLTSPYLTGNEPFAIQLGALKDAADARRSVDFWADRGMTSIKIYMNVAPDVAQAAIDEAHARGMKVAGHLCSIGFTDAAKMGFDSLEHGLLVDTEFYSKKIAGQCPNSLRPVIAELEKLDVTSAPVKAMIAQLVAHHVAVSSTLAVFADAQPAYERRALDVLDPGSKADLEKVIARATDPAPAAQATAKRYAALVAKEQAFEREFYAAGGLLTTGPDPTGSGQVLAGFGDQRAIESLVEGGFTPLDAIHIATENGAVSLGRSDRVGTIAAGKSADLILIKGNPAANIADIENVDVVFKDGIGYDSAKLVASVKGIVGRQ